MLPLKRLPRNGHIFISAPAFPADLARLQNGINYLGALGYKTIKGNSLKGNFGYLSATDNDHAAELNRAFADDDIDAIFCARGGWGGLRYLDQLDYKNIALKPKALIGYSDVTFLQLALWKKIGLPSISGPMVAVEMGTGIEAFTEKYFWELMHPAGTYQINLEQTETRIRQNGAVDGPLLGGCLSMMAHLLGTPYSPDYKDAVLFIEDVGEAPYKIDRYLAQLKQAGVFEQIKGLIIGQFLDCADERTGGFTIADLFDQYFNVLSGPILENFPYGHGMKKISMPIGAETTVDTRKGTLTFRSIWER